MLRLDDDQIGIALDGVGRNITPDDVDPRAMLLLASSFLALVEAIADNEGMDLGLRGLRVIDKCIATVTRSMQPTLAERIALHEVPRMMVEPDTAPSKAVAAAVKAFREQMIKLGPRFEVTTLGRDGATKIDLGATPPERTGYERVSMRAFLLRTGGAKDPTVQLQARGEPRPFVLAASDELAMQMAQYLYREIEFEARVQRRVADLSIAVGRVTSFVPVAKGYGVDEWRAYLRPAAERLAGTDIEEKLRRG